jgi:3'-5' exoribonuclease
MSERIGETPYTSAEEIKKELLEYATKYCSSSFVELIQETLSDYRFFVAPGSIGHHHAYVGGLAKHTLEVARVCVEAYKKQPKLDPDCLIGCAILHDCCKIYEYVLDRHGQYEKSEYYNLVGHVTGGAMLVDRRIPGRQDAVHCLLSHHGKREWGSPVTPRSVEAKILHDADYLCSREVEEVIPAEEVDKETFYPAHTKHMLEHVKKTHQLDVWLG